MAKKITAIPATKSKYTAQPLVSQDKRKVAGYARVSTDHEDQQSSYEAQMDYYTNYIQSRADWEFVGMYSDEGISATNTIHRDGFKQMVSDALSGKIDLIITKSVSRFARNTVDSLTTVRKLKEHGIEIYFEKENIWTLDAKGELLITIMSSLAQEESRSISENTTWGRRKQFADGHASVNFSRFLGYDRGKNGEFVVNREQAETVREIYKLFLAGLSYGAVGKELERQGRKAPGGGDKWASGTVKSILTNEKYKGDALLQKCYTVDFLTKKQAKNNGEVPQYYVEGHHEPIISPRKFQIVQDEVKRRHEDGRRYSGVSIFSSKLICEDCGSFFGQKVWHSNDKYRRVIWRCNHKYSERGKHCNTPHLTEDEIKALFLKAMNELLSEKDEVIANIEEFNRAAHGTDELQTRLETVTAELSALVKQTEDLIADNAARAQNQEEYQRKYNSLAERYEKKKAEFEDISNRIDDIKTAGEVTEEFLRILKGLDGAMEGFDVEVWGGMVESVIVHADKSATFLFKNELARITVK